MTVAEKFVQNTQKHFTWVSFLLSFLQVRMLTFRFHLGLQHGLSPINMGFVFQELS